MEYLEFTVSTVTAGSEIVSERLMAHGVVGTQIIDRADVPDPAKPNGYWELIDQSLIDAMPEDVQVKAWLEKNDTLGERVAAIKADLASLPSQYPDLPLGTLEISVADVAESDWAEEWKKYYKPFRAGKHLIVKPTWESYEPQEGDKIMEIDPGMAFGTGTHETTSMCMSLLEKYVAAGDRVIDVGTGSGILAMGAALLGANRVLAIDIDPTAVKVARENVAHNHLENTIDVVEGNLLDRVHETCDVCVANIIADVICMMSAPLRAHIRDNGTFICSGIIRERAEDVTNALNEAGYTILERTEKGEWVAFAARK